MKCKHTAEILFDVAVRCSSFVVKLWRHPFCFKSGSDDGDSKISAPSAGGRWWNSRSRVYLI